MSLNKLAFFVFGAIVIFTIIYLLIPSKATTPVITPKNVNPNQDQEVNSIGTIKNDGFVIHNMGNKVQISISDLTLFDKIFTPLVKKYKPQGVEFFFYNRELTVDDAKKFSKLRNFNGGAITAHLAAYQESFLQNTQIYTGTREDGVTEIHLSLIPTNSNPTDDQIKNISFEIGDEVIKRYITGVENSTNADVKAAGQAIFQAVKQGQQPFTIVVKP